MPFKIPAIPLLLGLLLLSACGQSVYQSPTLSKLGPNMQEEMEKELARTGYWNMPPVAKPTAVSALPSKPI